MATAMGDLSFVTHLEIEGLLGGGPGGGQQRRRLEARGLLPEPAWIRADRRRLGILPEFALASLVVPVRRLDVGHVALLEAIVADTRRLYGSSSFRSLATIIREMLPTFEQTPVTSGLLEGLEGRFRGEFEAWRADVGSVAERLVPLGLKIEAQRGRIVEVRGDVYVVRSSVRGTTESHPHSDAPFDLSDGLWVSRDRVHTLSSARDFLLPAFGPASVSSEGAGADPASEEDEAMFEEMFGSLGMAPRAVPRLSRTDEEDPLDVDEPLPQLVTPPVSLLRGATPMTRAQA